MALSDLEKLVQNMKRAQSITDRAATDATKHAAIMDSFEKRLELNSDRMTKIEEYDKLMSMMDQMGDNGGPALGTTFQSSATSEKPVVGGGNGAAPTNISSDIASDVERPEPKHFNWFHSTGRQM